MSDVKVKIQNIKLSKIKPYPDNPRINENAVEIVADLIEDNGFLVPIIVDKDMVIISGHTRRKAAQRLEYDSVPVIVATHLSDEKVKAFRIADNKSSEYATWDENLLIKELEELEQMGFELEGTAFSSDEIDCLMIPITADCLEDLDSDSVCGDIEKVSLNEKNWINVGIGTYKFKMHVKDYHVWEKKLLNEFTSTREVLIELLHRLGMANSVSQESQALSLKRDLIKREKAAEKK